jgi:hypothetical protein
MREDHQNERLKGEVQTETGESLKGPKPLNPNKQQQQGGAANTKQQGGGASAGQQQQGQGDERTPDKVQGQIKYAQGQTKKGEGCAGQPEASKLEPAKQGGIGGP